MIRACLFILVIFFINKTSFSQRIDTTLAAYADSYQPERIYIQFDKPAYSTGETVWFKAYVMWGNLPSTLSKNCYADFYDVNGNLLAHSVYPIIQSGAAGSFRIPDSLVGATLHMRAYTTWMLNWDSVFLFNKIIPVVQKTESEKGADINIIPSLHFFPEGGDVVEGLSSRIAFQAADQFGRPVSIKGFITNGKDAVIDTLQTEHDGMGSFRITYEKGEHYTADWTDEQHNKHQTPLLPSKSNGATLEITSAKGKKNFIIRRTEDAADDVKQLHIVATMHQQPVYIANINLTKNTTISGGISIDQLRSGVLQITLFSNDWKPLAERICFVNNNEALFDAGISIFDSRLEKRGKNKLEIYLPDSITSNLSIAITDKGFGVDSGNNIFSQLLLSGELRGVVYKPQYYFSNRSDAVAKHLDLVMLTHGWRRFNWQAIVAGKMPVIVHPAETNYLTFSGKIIGAKPKQLSTPGKIYAVLQAKDSSRQIASVDIKGDGTFADSSVILFDSANVIYRFSNNAFAFLKDVQFNTNILLAQPHIAVDKSEFILPDTTGNARLHFFNNEQAKLKELLKSTTLENVIVTTKVQSSMQLLDKRYAKGVFKVGDAVQFDLTKVTQTNLYRNVFDFLNQRIGMVAVFPGSTGTTVKWNGRVPLLYLDEDPIETNVLVSMQVSDIAYVKAFRSFFGSFEGGSAIAIYTKKGKDRPLQQGMFYKTVRGYTIVKEFYSPDYDSASLHNEGEDIRSTLYWNPMILTTPQDKKLSFDFYNNDITRAFRIIMEGISSNGKLIHIEKVVE